MNSRGVRKALLASLLPSLLVAVVLIASPAAAQDGSAGKNEVVLRADGGYYVVYEDGSLNIGGDVLGSCDAVLESGLRGPLEPTRETYRQVEVCEEASFQVPGSDSLPETGGPSLPLVATLGLIMACALCRLGTR